MLRPAPYCFSKELRISEKAIEDIKRRRRPRSKKVGLKMLYELFPKWLYNLLLLLGAKLRCYKQPLFSTLSS